MAMSWTTAEEIRAQVRKLWDSGRLLACVVDDVIVTGAAVASPREVVTKTEGPGELCSPAGCGREPTRDSDLQPAPMIAFPLALRFHKPSPRDLGKRFEDVRDWIRGLEDGSRSALSYGYDIEWAQANNRLLGRNATPCRIVVPTRADALAMLGATGTAQQFEALARETVARFPQLGGWLRRNPLAALAEADSWDRILSVLEWFRTHPDSGLYLRQIDIDGVDTKFIEPRKALLAQLLDAVLPSDRIDASCSGTAAFERRYGLAAKPPLVRLRILDLDLALSDLTDLTLRVDELARLDLSAARVFIVENEITGLAFPPRAKGMMIFGGGYAIERLAALPWLGACEVHYWGDIDTHGFAILDRLRAFLPDARSMLMDRQTLLDHRSLWTFEETPHIAPLTHLTPDEQALYDDLRFDRLDRGVRLEQERVPLQRLDDVTRSMPKYGPSRTRIDPDAGATFRR